MIFFLLQGTPSHSTPSKYALYSLLPNKIKNSITHRIWYHHNGHHISYRTWIHIYVRFYFSRQTFHAFLNKSKKRTNITHINHEIMSTPKNKQRRIHYVLLSLTSSPTNTLTTRQMMQHKLIQSSWHWQILD